MWNFLDSIFATYHDTGYTLQQFMYSFSPQNPKFTLTVIIAG